MVVGGELFFDDSIDRYASVGTNRRAGCTSDTFVGIFIGHKVVSPVVNLLRLKFEHSARTSYYAEVATLASFAVYVYCSYDFCHNAVND